MIKRGRQEGWLKEPIESLPRWATFHGVNFNHVKIGPLPGFEERGSTVIASRELQGGSVEPLLIVPKDLIISRTNIELFARADRHLREVLEAIGEFGRTTRGAVLTFLLVQATICCPDVKNIGVLNPLTEYIKYLPDELLPTFWSEEEQELLEGTTLKPAVRAKLNSLLREFESVRTATESIEWCAKYWWDEDHGMITFEDWMLVDAMYRSRALEFPGTGDCMMPCVDMANHASGEATAALYETDDDGNGLLLLREGKTVVEGGEITITVGWESDYIWLVVINEEDGLDFRIRQTVDGKREIQAFWKELELDDTSKLRDYLQEDPSWDVFQLRAVVLLQNQVEAQMETIQAMQGLNQELTVRDVPWRLAERLRNLEFDMLQRAALALDSQYLGMAEDDGEEVDFT
ncbi:hypothetical protein SNOG_10770 [Parastagonospora nodorum SN15]|uniref:SET domain-containing protein n=1 Tax=Phaeosphaeria nodorum (strain SN15 / ATCC MYA-4574 / FGSC 10173) TaxID=321614 RepID=Q0UBU4_PHANO|nr:hypothetical protein SNOG_10770 [Parastagonospora nodorum SN15]EAT82164.2 hypothetical protein SNOG_10770 [Parastagonospora nodorum SN15]